MHARCRSSLSTTLRACASRPDLPWLELLDVPCRSAPPYSGATQACQRADHPQALALEWLAHKVKGLPGLRAVWVAGHHLCACTVGTKPIYTV